MVLNPDVPVRTSPAAARLLEELHRETPGICALLGDSGCCGPGNVFLQAEPPRPSYLRIGSAGPVPIYADPSFLRTATAHDLVLDLRSVPVDDSLSLETCRGVRLTLVFERSAVRAPVAP